MRQSSLFPNLDLNELLVSSTLHQPETAASQGSSPDKEAGILTGAPLRPLRVSQLQSGGAPPQWRRGRSPEGSPASRGNSITGGAAPLVDSPSAADLHTGFTAAFTALDTDGDGVLGAADIKMLCAQLGLLVTEEEADALVADLSRPGAPSGVDFEQFSALLFSGPPWRGRSPVSRVSSNSTAGGASGSPRSATMPRPVAMPPHELDSAFAVFDADGDGFVSLSDACELLSRMQAPHTAIAGLIARADADCDGKLSRGEFASLLGQASQHSSSAA